MVITHCTPFLRGAFCQFLFRWVYYYGNNKSTGKETAKTHLCAVLCCASTEAVAAQARVVVLMLHVYLYFGLRLLLAVHLQWLHATPLLAWLQVYALIAWAPPCLASIPWSLTWPGLWGCSRPLVGKGVSHPACLRAWLPVFSDRLSPQLRQIQP